jgi:nitrogen fixation protein FixH
MWSNPFPVVGAALASFFTVLIAVELVVALVKQALSADVAEGGEL